jgi:uncharacterized protein
MDKVVRKTYQTETKAAGEDRVLSVRISTVNPDRSKDVVIPKGAILTNYKRNPVVALGHNYSGLAVAKADNIQITDDAIFAKVQFPPQGVYDVADTVYELYKGGFMNAWSIGFVPVDYTERKDGGYEFKEWELLEFSAVLVPDNPEALTIARSKGIDTAPVEAAVKKVEKPKKKLKKAKHVSETPKVMEITEHLYNELVAQAEELKVLKTQAETKEEQSVEKQAEPEGAVELDLVEALRVADKVIGVALRNYKEGKKQAELSN